MSKEYSCDMCNKEKDKKELDWLDTPYGEALACEDCRNE